jgi:hypothetical protein
MISALSRNREIITDKEIKFKSFVKTGTMAPVPLEDYKPLVYFNFFQEIRLFLFYI